MIPRIEMLHKKKLVGIKMVMSYSDNRTHELWRTFMPRLKEIKNNIGSDLFSVQKYGSSFFDNFKPDLNFEKWVSIEVSDFENIPHGMQAFILENGLYAVFHYKGLASEGALAFQYIFGTWLPNSEFFVDNRPHFEILGDNYKNESPDSEEEIWIPVRKK